MGSTTHKVDPHGRDGDTEELHRVVLEAHEAAIAAHDVYGDFASMHEAYGVLAEEVAELFDAVRMRQTDTQRLPSIRAEAIQVACVALRIAEQAGREERKGGVSR